ncbi:MAG: hypothetical protein ABGX16_05285 [Pirellulales bacterium]
MRMTSSVSHWFIFLSLAHLGSCSLVCRAHAGTEDSVPHDSLVNWTDPISRTVIRHFQSQEQYHVGDLIVRSQVAEIQDYMRKTRGISASTNSMFRKRVVADQDPLARTFNSAGNDRLIREAAILLGGYGPLDQLCKLKFGRQILATTIHQSNLEMLVEYVHGHGVSSGAAQASSANAEEKPNRERSKIYTVEDLPKAMHQNRQGPADPVWSH